MSKLGWTLAAVTALGGTAMADSLDLAAPAAKAESVTIGASARGVAEDYLVLPKGGELTSQLKFVMADTMLGGEPLKFTDLALFGITGRWALFSKLEIAASADFLPKQPSYTDEKPWQSVSFALRSPLGHHVALSVSGAGGHLLAHTGRWTREAMMLEWKKPICCGSGRYSDEDSIVAFDLQGGVDAMGLSAAHGDENAILTEIGTQFSTLVREPSGHWGAWLGIAYAIPVQHSGTDPTTDMGIRPQPRLDFHIGTVVSIEHRWDLFVDFAVIDRGDLRDPSTRLPILDGGFDQKQVVFGVTRQIHLGDGDHRRRDYDDVSMAE